MRRALLTSRSAPDLPFPTVAYTLYTGSGSDTNVSVASGETKIFVGYDLSGVLGVTYTSGTWKVVVVRNTGSSTTVSVGAPNGFLVIDLTGSSIIATPTIAGLAERPSNGSFSDTDAPTGLFIDVLTQIVFGATAVPTSAPSGETFVGNSGERIVGSTRSRTSAGSAQSASSSFGGWLVAGQSRATFTIKR